MSSSTWAIVRSRRCPRSQTGHGPTARSRGNRSPPGCRDDVVVTGLRNEDDVEAVVGQPDLLRAFPGPTPTGTDRDLEFGDGDAPQSHARLGVPTRGDLASDPFHCHLSTYKHFLVYQATPVEAGGPGP